MKFPLSFFSLPLLFLAYKKLWISSWYFFIDFLLTFNTFIRKFLLERYTCCTFFSMHPFFKDQAALILILKNAMSRLFWLWNIFHSTAGKVEWQVTSMNMNDFFSRSSGPKQWHWSKFFPQPYELIDNCVERNYHQ